MILTLLTALPVMTAEARAAAPCRVSPDAVACDDLLISATWGTITDGLTGAWWAVDDRGQITVGIEGRSWPGEAPEAQGVMQILLGRMSDAGFLPAEGGPAAWRDGADAPVVGVIGDPRAGDAAITDLIPGDSSDPVWPWGPPPAPAWAGDTAALQVFRGDVDAVVTAD